MTLAELSIAIERHMAEAEMHITTAQALLDVASGRNLSIGSEAKPGGWVQ